MFNIPDQFSGIYIYRTNFQTNFEKVFFKTSNSFKNCSYMSKNLMFKRPKPTLIAKICSYTGVVLTSMVLISELYCSFI